MAFIYLFFALSLPAQLLASMPDGIASSELAASASIAAIEMPLSNQALPGPAAIHHYSYAGCMGSESWSPETTGEFQQVEGWDHMNVNQCVSDCYHAAFAAIWNTTCYCSRSSSALQDMSTYPDASCNIPCGARPEQRCGGKLHTGAFFEHRQRSADDGMLVLTVYASSREVRRDDAVDSAPLADQVVMAKLSDSVTPTAISATYMTVCTPPVCLKPHASETVTTVTALSTSGSPAPTVPMTSTAVTDPTDNHHKIILVPDEEEIEAMVEDVSEWVASHSNDDAISGAELSSGDAATGVPLKHIRRGMFPGAAAMSVDGPEDKRAFEEPPFEEPQFDDAPVKRQDPAATQTDPILTIALMSSETSSAVPIVNSTSSVPYPMGNSTTVHATATSAVPPGITNGPVTAGGRGGNGGTGTGQQAPKQSLSSPSSRPGKYLRYVAVAGCVVWTAVWGLDTGLWML